MKSLRCEDCPFGSPDGCTFTEWLWRHQSDGERPCDWKEDEEADE